MYIYLQFNRVNIIQVWLAGQGQAETNKVHKIQHCMTFSFVQNVPKRQNTLEEAALFMVTLKRSGWKGKNPPPRAGRFVLRRVRLRTYKNIQNFLTPT